MSDSLHKHQTVLVIDDDKSVCQGLEFVLSEKYQVQVSNTVEEGLLQIRRQRPHLVILDLCLPDHHGSEGLRMIHQTDPEIPVIILTGYPEYKSAVDALRDGAFDYLEKPVNTFHLVNRIAAAMAGDVKSGKISRNFTQVSEVAETRSGTKELIHDLNNALMVLELSVSALHFSPDVGHTEAQIKVVLKQIDYIHQLINHLSKSHGLSGDTHVKSRLRDLIEEAKEVAMPLVAGKDVEVVWHSTDIELEKYLSIDRISFCRMMTNLMNNAVCALEKNKQGRIIIKFSQRDDRCLVSITDNGTGIHPENIKHLFSKNWTTKVDKENHGLGLTLTERMVNQHGGHVFFHSQVDCGTVFMINLPLI